MKHLFLNILCFFTIAFGALFLTKPVNASNFMMCSDWELDCTEVEGQNICCTICSDDGRIGDCVPIDLPDQ